ncbi:exodeoxyribonuclease III [Methanobrevibacter sp. DSM 116169]|uniref:exodeoxyribonuclease III n=1 Tax=Methanobrevibacter sp. DSM 116169 TaxID=3242727 RepID=UPI0038FD3354
MSEIKLSSWNINGIRAISKKEEFKNWFESVDSDLILFQETKAQLDQIPKNLYKNEKYLSYFNSASKKGYSGVAAFSKIEPNEVINGMGIEKFDTEGRFLRLDFDDFILINVYWPNGGMGPDRLQYKMDYYDAFLDYVDNLKEAGNNLIICGDLNTAHKPIDIARPKENEKVSGFMPIEREWVSKFLDSGFVDTFRMFNDKSDQYTWWSYRTRARMRNVGWRLDYFFVNDDFKGNVVDSYIESDVMGSDHCPIGLKVNL